MGSPMLSDFFHKQRWDYMYSTREDDDQVIKKHVALYFNGDALAKIEGDLKPQGNGLVKPSVETSIIVQPRKLDQTLWEKITDLFDWEAAPVAQDRVVPNESNNIPVKKF
jgi:outer membrane protein assembly factor BamE